MLPVKAAFTAWSREHRKFGESTTIDLFRGTVSIDITHCPSVLKVWRAVCCYELGANRSGCPRLTLSTGFPVIPATVRSVEPLASFCLSNFRYPSFCEPGESS